MAKPSRSDLVTKATGAGVAWNCRKCGQTGLATSRAEAGKQFDRHTHSA